MLEFDLVHLSGCLRMLSYSKGNPVNFGSRWCVSLTIDLSSVIP